MITRCAHFEQRPRFYEKTSFEQIVNDGLGIGQTLLGQKTEMTGVESYDGRLLRTYPSGRAQESAVAAD